MDKRSTILTQKKLFEILKLFDGEKLEHARTPGRSKSSVCYCGRGYRRRIRGCREYWEEDFDQWIEGTGKDRYKSKDSIFEFRHEWVKMQANRPADSGHCLNKVAQVSQKQRRSLKQFRFDEDLEWIDRSDDDVLDGSLELER